MPPGSGTSREALFAALYDEHFSAVSRYVRRRCPREGSDDVIHEVFLVAWRRLDDVPAEPLPWLLGVARNTLANDIRSRRRRDALIARLAATRLPQEEFGAEPTAADISPEVREALEALSEPALEALLLTAWEGLSPADAAQVLGCSATTFRARLYRARRVLAAALERSGADVEQEVGDAT
jgi:RNA polymerase sigma-70 factor (ECF subfamily)